MIYCATKRNKIVENAIDIKLIYCMHFAITALQMRGMENLNHEEFMRNLIQDHSFFSDNSI